LHVWLLRIVGALTAPTCMALPCRWRSRPQHQEPTYAVQQNDVLVARLLDHLVGVLEERLRDSEAQCFRCLEIDNEFELGGELHR
jgi:hypothetical protein